MRVEGALVMERAPYAVAGRAGREAVAAALAQRCSREELAMLHAVIARTALWSRLEDTTTVAELSAEANLHPKNGGNALRSLAARGVIRYEGRRGSGAAWVALPAEMGADSAPNWASGPSEIGADSAPNIGADSAPISAARPLIGEKDREVDDDDGADGLDPADVLAAFNEQAGTNWRGPSWLRQIADIVGAFPDVTLDQHRDAVRHTVALAGEAKWWDGARLRPSHVYGSSRAFERALHLEDDPFAKFGADDDDLSGYTRGGDPFARFRR